MEIEIVKKIKANVKYIHFDIPLYEGDIEYHEDDSELGLFIEESKRLTLTIDIETGNCCLWGGSCLRHDFKVYSKVRDEGTYRLLDENHQEIIKYQGYVPDILSCIDNGWGDYLSMIIHPNGDIDNWDPDNIYDFVKTINEED